MSDFDPWLTGPHITLNRARQSLSAREHGQMLEVLAPGQPVARRIAHDFSGMFSAERMNSSEDRAVGHWALRKAASDASDATVPDRFAPAGQDLIPQMRATHQLVRDLVDAIRSGQWRTSAGQVVRHVIHLGIGGSDTGPQLLLSALQPAKSQPSMQAHFLANLDHHAVEQTLSRCDPTATLVIMASKSFTTQETVINARHVLEWMRQGKAPNPEHNVVAVTAEPERALRWGIPAQQVFWFDHSIGGRFSVWGPVSFTARVILGNAAIDQFIAGGLSMDQHVLAAPLSRCLPAVLAATDHYNLRTRKLPTLMVSAYDSRLTLLVPYLKQLWMESLGKHIGRDGQPLDGPGCPILWGDVGTNAQHAFFQLLHQGAQGVSIELIASIHPGHGALATHDALWANLIAQAQALSSGQAHEDAAKTCWGGHPVTMVLLEQLDPRSLGALIALWEHRVVALAAIHKINPFDQWGVELGKSIAKSALEAISGTVMPGGPDASPALDPNSQLLIQWFREHRQTTKKQA